MYQEMSEFDKGYYDALRSMNMVEEIPNPQSDYERGWNAYANETE